MTRAHGTQGPQLSSDGHEAIVRGVWTPQDGGVAQEHASNPAAPMNTLLGREPPLPSPKHAPRAPPAGGFGAPWRPPRHEH
jgi:hypothetical protein